MRRHTCAASTRALKNHRAGIDNFTSMEVERNREAKIDLYSSFVGWLTNAVERDGGEAEWWASSVNGQKPIRCRSGIECRALSSAFYRLNRWVLLVGSCVSAYTSTMKDINVTFFSEFNFLFINGRKKGAEGGCC